MQLCKAERECERSELRAELYKGCTVGDAAQLCVAERKDERSEFCAESRKGCAACALKVKTKFSLFCEIAKQFCRRARFAQKCKWRSYLHFCSQNSFPLPICDAVA